MQRRVFIRNSVKIAGGAILLPWTQASCGNSAEKPDKSRLVIARDQKLLDSVGKPDEKRTIALLDKAICSYFHVENPKDAWSKIFKPGESVGLKINCLSGRGSTHNVLVNAITERLQEAGIRQLIIWDRFNSDLEDGGFQVVYKDKNIRCFGNDALGFEDTFESFGKAASLVCKTLTRQCDSIINIPLIKDHGIAGITMAMKNMFGAIHNPHKFHLNIGDPYIADVYCYPSIRKKIKLNIADLFWAQYEGGPSFMPQWRWPYSGIMISEDPVAMDYTGWQIIEKKRSELGLKSLKLVGREPTYISTAANPSHGLGTNNPSKMDIIQI